ncbi:MAG: glycogen/starch synthase [Saprospiraceae bacterium]
MISRSSSKWLLAQRPTASVFPDNDDFFKRKSVFTDEGKPFADNPERMIFFCKGVIETVRKFGWPPDIIHCHGWMTSLIPIFIREAYKTEPLFHHSKIIYSVYNNSMEKSFDNSFISKASINSMETEDLHAYMNGTGVTLDKGAVHYADALIRGSEELNEELENLLATTEKPVLDYQNEDELLGAYVDFYHTLLEEETVEQ